MGQVLVWVLVLASTAVTVGAGEVIDRVLAVVAGEMILLSDVRTARDFGLVDPGGSADPDREALSRLIDRTLILAEVDRYVPPEPSTDAVDAALRMARARFASAEAFELALARAGLDADHLREMLRQDLLMRAYLEQRFAADSADRRRLVIDEWVAGLRRRAEIVDLYGSSR